MSASRILFRRLKVGLLAAALPFAAVSGPAHAVVLPLPAPTVTAPVLATAGNALLTPAALLATVSPQVSGAVSTLGGQLAAAKAAVPTLPVDPLAIAYQAAGGTGTPPALNSVTNLDVGTTHVIGPNPSAGNPLGVSVGSPTQATGTLLDLGVLAGGKPATISLHGH